MHYKTITAITFASAAAAAPLLAPSGLAPVPDVLVTGSDPAPAPVPVSFGVVRSPIFGDAEIPSRDDLVGGDSRDEDVTSHLEQSTGARTVVKRRVLRLASEGGEQGALPIAERESLKQGLAPVGRVGDASRDDQVIRGARAVVKRRLLRLASEGENQGALKIVKRGEYPDIRGAGVASRDDQVIRGARAVVKRRLLRLASEGENQGALKIVKRGEYPDIRGAVSPAGGASRDDQVLTGALKVAQRQDPVAAPLGVAQNAGDLPIDLDGAATGALKIVKRGESSLAPSAVAQNGGDLPIEVDGALTGAI